MKTRKILLPFMIWMIAFGLVGCMKVDNQNKQNVAIKEFEAITEINPDSPDVYLIVKALNNNYWDTITKCVADAAKKQGCNIYYSGSQVETDVETQIVLLQKAVDAGADAIIIAPDDSLVLSEPITTVYERGIPVVLIDTTITAENYDVCFMTDNLLAGKVAAAEMIYQLQQNGCKENETVSIAVQVGSGSSQTISERLAGFTQYWSECAPEKWTIIEEVKINNGNIDVAEEIGNEFLKQYSEIKGMFGCNNGSTVGFAKAIMNHHRTDIALIGFDYSDEMAAIIDNPDYCAETILQRQDLMASQAVSSVMDLLDGKQSQVKFVDTGIKIISKETIQTEEVQEILLLLND